MDNLQLRVGGLIAALRRGEPLEMEAPEFFGQVVEPLCDAFEPAYCDLYAELMCALIGDASLLGRYERVRRAAPWLGPDPATVYVLSRVTLGADVVVTSTVLDGVKRRFPRARIMLVGSRKSWELFAADPRIGFIEAPYARGGTVEQRLTASWALAGKLDLAAALVVDPDSRLTQLGIIPVCPEEGYRFFESRAYGGAGTETLAELARAWMREVFGVEASPYLAPVPAAADVAPGPLATVSLGVGGNQAKRIDDQFERGLIEALAARGLSVLVDYGADPEEEARVGRAIAGLPVSTWRGAFAPFAARIRQSAIYVGYDSAGQHVAAVSGVPLVTVFTGFATERTFERWRPWGAGPKATLRCRETAWRDTLAALDELLA